MIRTFDGAAGGNDLFDLREWMRILWRRRYTVMICVALGLLLGVLAVVGRPKTYFAEAVVALDARKVQILPGDEVVSRLPQESPVLRTELDIIRSRSMAERVLESLPPGFIDAGSVDAAEAPAAGIGGMLHGLLERVGLASAVPAQEPPRPEPDDPRRGQVDRLLDGLNVSNDGRSFTIFVSYEAKSPEIAAIMANAYAKAYIDQQLEHQASSTRTASDWLGAKVDDLRARLETSEANVQSIRQGAGLYEVGGLTPQVSKLNALSTELSAARSALAAAEARLSAVVTASTDSKSVHSFSDVLASPVVRELRQQRADISREVDEIRGAGAMKSSRLPVLENKLVALDASLSEEVGRIIGSLEHEVDIARLRLATLQTEFANLETDLASDSDAMVEIDQMQREVDANKLVYESFLTRYKQSIEQQGLSLPEARVISWAEPPGGPSSSRMPKLLLGLMFGLAAGVSLAFVREKLDQRVRSAAHLEKRTGTPVLSLVPRCRRTLLVPPQMNPVAQPLSPYSVAVRKLCATLRVSSKQGGSRVLLLTSHGAGEGKTTLAVAMARSYALSGESVVLVDANLVSPEVAAVAGINKPAGYLNALLDDRSRSFEDVLSKDPWTNLRIVSAMARPHDAGYMLGSQAFTDLIAELREAFAVVIIDSPAVSQSADATLLGGLADEIVLVVRWGSTLEDDVVSNVRHFDLCDIPVAGIVVERVEPGAIAETESGTIHRRPAPASLNGHAPMGADAARRRNGVSSPAKNGRHTGLEAS